MAAGMICVADSRASATYPYLSAAPAVLCVAAPPSDEAMLWRTVASLLGNLCWLGWKSTTGGHKSAALARRLRAFGEYRGLVLRVLAEETRPADTGDVYSDIVLLDPQAEQLFQFVSDIRRGGRGGALAIAGDETDAESWSRSLASLEKSSELRRFRGKVGPETDRRADEMLGGYVESSVAAGLGPILPLNLLPFGGFLLAADKVRVDDVYSRLVSHMEELTWEELVGRGRGELSTVYG
ncbi:hypothetical protein ABGB17_09845 [Sphaerisporangium sp. B11E5]|uniref:hypothetical protein n=1 Tax=Sphaerisporangium sp. B11E5 TaxID=3153563 RepID=UPI00325CD1E3